MRPAVGERGAGYVSPGVDARRRLVEVAGVQQAPVGDVPRPGTGEAVGLELPQDADLQLPLSGQPGLDGVAELMSQDVRRGEVASDVVRDEQAGLVPRDEV